MSQTSEAIAKANPPAMSKSGRVVTVACKLPHGLSLRLHEFITVMVPVLGGGLREERQARTIGETVRIFGTAVLNGQSLPHEVIGGYALTPNVDAEFWTAWVRQNSDHDAIKNNLLFAQERTESARDEAKELNETRSGLERLDPSMVSKAGKQVHADTRIPRRIETAEKPGADAAY